MKTTHTTFFLWTFLALAFAACSDWLDVKPSTQIEKEDAEQTLTGYESMLIGAYIQMQSPLLYGKQMTYSAIEYMAEHWNSAPVNSAESALATHDYDNEAAEKLLSDMMNAYYKVIFDVNSLLSNIDDHRDILTDHHYELIKGEALGLRAFCHLELLRLWGPLPGQADAEPLLAYVTRRGKEINERLPYDAYVAHIEADLDAAEALLKDIDPVTDINVSPREEIALVGTGKVRSDFFTERRKRFNYYACLGAKARFYLWTGQTELAARYAREVIDAKDNTGKSIFTYGTRSDMEQGDYTLSAEHIFCIDLPSLERNTGLEVYAGRSYKLSRLFKSTDLRLTKLFYDRTESGNVNTYTSTYLYVPGFTDVRPRALCVVPLLRLSEMKLILAEALGKEQGIDIVNELGAQRDLQPLSASTSDSNWLRTLVQEYHREFYAEGQGFFASKRIWPKLDVFYPVANNRKDEAIYRLPLPKAETLTE